MRQTGTVALFAVLCVLAQASFSADTEVLRTRAERGDAAAQFQLGNAYAHGEGVTQDYDTALQWYRRAAKQRFAAAESSLASAYFAGVVVPADRDAALRWLRLSAQHGDAQAQAHFGIFLQDDSDTQGQVEAVKWLRLSAGQGNLTGQLFLGNAYAHGEGVRKNEAEALKWWTRSAQQGDADSQYGVGLMHWNGEGTPADEKEALRWFRAAAAQGLGNAHLRVGQFLAAGKGIAPDAEQAWLHFQLAADAKESWQHMLETTPWMRDMLKRVETQLSAEQKAAVQARLPEQRIAEARQALLQLRRQAEAGDPQAQYDLAFKYALGELVDKDEAAAIGWWRRSAEQGYKQAMAELGFELWEADAPLRNRTQALRWLDRASELGVTNASRYLGKIYWLGRGVAEDDARAWNYTARCADSEDGECVAQLARFTHLGVGSGKDESKARELYEKAIKLGSSKAKCDLGLLLDRQDDEAQRGQQLMLQAADAGEAVCQYKAGGISAGAGDMNAALDWFEKSAAQGNREGMRTAVSMLLYVPEVRDVARAEHETERCWDSDLSTCAVLLGAYHADATPPDLARARQNLRRAHEHGDRYATRILAELEYFNGDDDAQAQPLLSMLADTDAQARWWLARLDASTGNSAQARASMLALRERFSVAADWLLARWCRGARDCPADIVGADALVARVKRELANTHGDPLNSLRSILWDKVDLLAADPHSDRDDGAFALRIARLLPTNFVSDDRYPTHALETLALAQARAAQFKAACTSQTQAIAQLSQQQNAKPDADVLRLATARQKAYCAGKPWNQRVFGAGHLFAENFGT